MRALAQRLTDALAALARLSVAADAAHYAGASPAEVWRERKRRVAARCWPLREALRMPEFVAGDAVAGPRGSPLTIEAWSRSESVGGAVYYHTIDSRGVRELWPAEALGYAVATVAAA